MIVSGLITFPDELCFWTSILNDDGMPETLTYQDDGFGNLILINKMNVWQIRSFRFGTGRT